MAIKFTDDPQKSTTADRIIEGAKDAASIAKGEKPAARTHEPSKFDRNAYQREYMRKRRAAAKVMTDGS